MATRRFSLFPGGHLEDLVEAAGAATATNAIELTVDCATSIVTEGGTTRVVSREEVLIALETFKQYILRVQWPPV